MTIEEAAGLLITSDSWPYEHWSLTNDAEEYLRGTTLSYPHMFVINLFTMEVVSATSGPFGDNGYDSAEDLIETIMAF